MITPLLKHSLEPIVARQRLLRTLRWTALSILACAALAALGAAPVAIVLLTLAALWMGKRAAANWEPDYRGIARQVEARHPELHALLLTAVEQQPDVATGKLGFLQQRVLSEAAAQARKQQWVKTVPGWTVFAHSVALLAAFAVLGWTVFRPQSVAAPIAQREAAPPALPEGVEVTPGDVSIERGSGLVVLATFGPDVPSEATLVLHSEKEPERRAPLAKNLDDPVFGGGLAEVDSALTYRIEYAGKTTRDFHVEVFEYPRLERADATLHFPEYTKLADKQVPDTRRVSAVEGTKLDLGFQLNKPVKTAKLVAKDGTELPLAIEADQPTAALSAFPVAKSQSYELQLVDHDGRTSKVPAQILIEALPNRRPELKFVTPKGDQRLSPLEEVAFRAEAWDDFGLARYGLTFNVAGRGEQQVELGTVSGADERRAETHLLKLEELGVKPDELVSWFLWAEDTGPDGKPRRTATDMFFGEVRPFEEIFRPGDSQESEQQQQQQAGGAAREVTKLAELQKQVISATWNLKRAEDGAAESPTSKYLKDVPVVRDSQSDALKMATALAEKAEDPKGKALIADVTTEMEAAVGHLTEAAEKTEPLPQALASEQAAYNALLKLAAHTFRVSRQQSSSSSSSQAAQRNQQQLDELDLKEEKQRYETKSQAAPEQNEQQREQLAVLNRLKELAQRQEDINERLQELQTALQAAQSEKEKEEIKRQLKRLREEEQQLLA
ncbi:MAG TPA: hypothetical protein VGO90_10165, partial [Chthoniobacteraceae bacterium]|nr:hypothetical protein [Chthoniobacteraceae bacterium]